MGFGRIVAAAGAAMLLSCAAHAQQGKGCDLPNADKAIHGIVLGDEQSTVRVLGRAFDTIVDDPAARSPWIIFASRDNKQLLLLRHHAGDPVNSFVEFEVKFGRHDRHPKKLPVYEFISGNGTKLGQWRRTIVGRLGPCFTSKRDGDIEILRYERKEPGKPPYYAEYEFFNGRLHRFRFGYASR